jgi:hypothetical protein
MVDMDMYDAEYKLPVTGNRSATWKASAFQYVDPFIAIAHPVTLDPYEVAAALFSQK